MRWMFRRHLQLRSDLDLRFISGENLGFEDQKVEHLKSTFVCLICLDQKQMNMTYSSGANRR